MKDKVVIITGASSGIGRATARAFTGAGAVVVPAARTSDPPCDITHPDQVRQLIARTLDRHGRIDILINNAGLGLRGLVAETQPADAQRVLDVNFFAAVDLIQAVLPVMQRQGAGQIVNVSSVIGVVATPRNSIYCASKFALRALSEALRVELRGTGLEVISILPGYTDTPFFQAQIRYGGPERLSPFRGQSPAHVARVILHACRRHRREVTLSFLGHLGCWAHRLAPRVVEWSLRRAV
jgi:short-subunit dehydrogenase